MPMRFTGRPSFLCSACAKAYDAITRNARLTMLRRTDRDNVAKLIKQLDESDRYRRFVTVLEHAKARRDQESIFVLENLSRIKTKLNRFVSGGRRFSPQEQKLIASFLVRWDLHLSAEKTAAKMRAGAVETPRPRKRWIDIFFLPRKRPVASIGPSSAAR